MKKLIPILIFGLIFVFGGCKKYTSNVMLKTKNGDINWSTEALVNVIKNCVEHTPIGGNSYIKYEQNPLYLEIIIKDDG